jgi:hypothetical protein
MTKPKKTVHNTETKSQERKFLAISFLVTVILLIMLYFVFRNAF